MQHRGTWLILGIFGLAFCLAAIAWNHQRLRGRQVLAYYGNDTAWLIRLAPEVDLWQLESPLGWDQLEPAIAVLQAGNVMARAQHIDLSNRPGWTHARQALIEDRSYDWSRRRLWPNTWTHVLRFRSGEHVAMILLDLPNGRLRDIRRTTPLLLNPRMAEGFRTFLVKM